MTTPAFIPGIELSRRFYLEAVHPLLEQAVPGIVHSAARLGSGSEVLGCDTARSADHEWGPRLKIFLSPGHVTRYGAKISDLLSDRLPKVFHGYPTHFAATDEAGIGVMRVTEGPVHHRVDVTDPGTWLTERLGFDPRRHVTLEDWLATPTQRLAEVTASAVFHDGLGQLGPARSQWTAATRPTASGSAPPSPSPTRSTPSHGPTTTALSESSTPNASPPL